MERPHVVPNRLAAGGGAAKLKADAALRTGRLRAAGPERPEILRDFLPRHVGARTAAFLGSDFRSGLLLHGAAAGCGPERPEILGGCLSQRVGPGIAGFQRLEYSNYLSTSFPHLLSPYCRSLHYCRSCRQAPSPFSGAWPPSIRSWFFCFALLLPSCSIPPPTPELPSSLAAWPLCSVWLRTSCRLAAKPFATTPPLRPPTCRGVRSARFILPLFCFILSF